MNLIMYRFRLWWGRLSSREQGLLMLLGLCLSLLIFVVGIWQPIVGGQRAAQQQLANESELLDWVQSRANSIESLRKSGDIGATTAQPLNQVIATSSKEFNISLIRLQPRGEEIQVWVTPLPFNRLLDWIAYLSAKKGIQVVALDVERGDHDGAVEVRRLQFK